MSVLPYPSPFNPNLQYPNQIATELNNANQNFITIDNQLTTIDNNITVINNDITLLNSNKANIDLSNVPQNILKPIAGFSSPIDLTNATSDYMLQVGEVARIDFSNSLSIPLHIATQSGTCYNFWLIPSNPSNANNSSYSIIFLYPNNSAYSNAFRCATIYMGANGFGYAYYSYQGFRICDIYGSIFGVITNYTQYKNVKTFTDFYGYSASYNAINIFSNAWVDTTTSWTSLGAITTTTYPISGTILVQRIL